MKVLHVINNLGSGGAEKLIEETLPLLNKVKGIQAEVLLLTDENNVFQKNLEENGVKVEVISLRSIYNPLNIFKLKKHIDKGKYNIVHSHLFPSQYWVGIAKSVLKNKNIKFFTTEHSNHNRRRDKSFFRPIDRFIYSRYDTIICITDKVRSNLIKWLKPKKRELDKFVVINNGVDIKKYRKGIPYKKSEIKDNFTEQTKLICMVGRFSEAKDHSTLIKAMRYLPNDLHLLLIGEGPLKQQNEDFAKEIGVNNRVHFLGFRDDIDRLLKTSDIIVLSSHWEGLSLASIEAMASGKPFIASRVPGLEEIVCGYGLLFEEGDYEEFAEVILKLLNNNDFYNEVKNNCLKRAKDYTIESMLERTINVYLKQM